MKFLDQKLCNAVGSKCYVNMSIYIQRRLRLSVKDIQRDVNYLSSRSKMHVLLFPT